MDIAETNAQACWNRRTLWLLLALFALRAGYLGIVPLELCADEAYYWDWSRQLDWGYYSKPPMIAWLIAGTRWLLGDSEVAIRFPAVVLSTLGLWPVYRLAAELFSPRVGFWSVVVTAATPGMVAMSLLMTIDAPFLCAWAFAIWSAWRVVSPKRPSWPRVGLAIVVTGLGLLSKQTMVAIIPLTGLWLLMQPGERHKLWSSRIWAWWCGSLACLAPVVIWNARHGWITLQHTSEHFQQRTVTWSKHLQWFLEFWGGQFGVVSPISCGLMIGLTVSGLWTWHAQDRRVRFLLCLGAVPMVGVTALSLVQPIQPNWPAAFVLPSLLLLSAWGCGELPGIPLRGFSRGWFPVAIATGVVFASGVYVTPLTIPRSSLAGGRFDPTVRLRGWAHLGQSVGGDLAALKHPNETLLIAATGRGPVSLLAYYVPGQPLVYRWNSTGIVESQHEVWGGPRGNVLGWEALIVTPEGQFVPPELAMAFASMESRGAHVSHLGGDRWERLHVWHARGFRGWPRDGTRSEPLPELQEPPILLPNDEETTRKP